MVEYFQQNSNRNYKSSDKIDPIWHEIYGGDPCDHQYKVSENGQSGGDINPGIWGVLGWQEDLSSNHEASIEEDDESKDVNSLCRLEVVEIGNK